MDDQSDHFSQLFVRSLELTMNDSEVTTMAVIGQLLNLNYNKRIYAITKQIAGEILCHFARDTKVVTQCSEQLMMKYFKLIVQITSSQELTLEEKDANDLIGLLHSTWKTCFGCPRLLQALLEAIAAITYQIGPYVSQENLVFLMLQPESRLPRIVQDTTFDISLRRVAVQCLAGLCVMLENGGRLSDECMEVCLKTFISAFQEQEKFSSPDILTCRMVFSLTKGLQNILSSSSNVHMLSIRPLLSLLKKYMVCGLPGLVHATDDELQPVPVPELYPAKQNDAARGSVVKDTQQKLKDKKKKRKPRPKSKLRTEATTGSASFDPSFGMEQLNLGGGQSAGGRISRPDLMQFRPLWSHVTSSESEYSDNEGAQKAKLRSFLSKIRQTCLGVLYLTVKRTDKHTLLGYWSSFLPDSQTLLTGSSSSLFTSIMQDPSPKCRAAALGVIGAMMEGSRWFLSLAAEETSSSSPRQTSSFVPFSASLAASVREVHKQLFTASSKEQSVVALVQLLKTLCILINNTPYHKMRPGLLVKMASQTRYFLSNSHDINVRVTCLNVLGAIVSTSAPLPEVTDILTDFKSNNAPSEQKGSSSSSQQLKSSDSLSNGFWLVEKCLSLASKMSPSQASVQPTHPEPCENHANLRVASLQTLGRVVKGYLQAVQLYISAFADLICQCLEDSVVPVRLHACKLLEELGSSLLQLSKIKPSAELEKESFSVWQKVLNGPLQSVFHERSSSALQGEACDSLSTIGQTVFQSLPKNLQMLCITLLVGFSSDDNALIRSKSVRALGVYIMYPCLREDIVFVEDVSYSVLRLLSDQFLSVRASAAWSLGNLTDTLVINSETRPSFRDEFQDSLYLQLFNKGIQAMEDKDKVRFNIMRVLGNLLRFAEKNHAEDSKFKEAMLKSVQLLSKMVAETAMVKVRWNACIACSNFLRNTNLPLGDAKWTSEVYTSLCKSVNTSKNFKVRIKAALALSTPTKSSHYGTLFCEVFSCLIHGLEESNLAADFTEFKFKDTLQDQLCTTLIHMINIMESEDLPAICSCLHGKEEEINAHLSTYMRKISHSIELEREGTTNGSLNSSASSAMDGLMGSGTMDQSYVSDAVEEYIVAKQLTAQEKLNALNQAMEMINQLTPDDDVNENTLHSKVKGKEVFDSKLLARIFTFESK